MPLRVRHHALTILAGVSAALLLAVLIAWVAGQWRADRFSLENSNTSGALRFYIGCNYVAFLASDVSTLLWPTDDFSSLAFSHDGYLGTRTASDSLWDAPVPFIWPADWPPPHVHNTFWEFAGFLLNYIRTDMTPVEQNHTLVLVAIPNWFLALLCLPLPLLWFRRYLRLRRQRRLGTHFCPQCNYDLRGTPAQSPALESNAAAEQAMASPTKTCPECGWKGPLPA